LENADLQSANLRDTDLSGANLDNALLKGTVYDDRTTWPAGFPESKALAAGAKKVDVNAPPTTAIPVGAERLL
jgi:uncharacterized protein YjbI with pentapeptide repeats